MATPAVVNTTATNPPAVHTKPVQSEWLVNCFHQAQKFKYTEAKRAPRKLQGKKELAALMQQVKVFASDVGLPYCDEWGERRLDDLSSADLMLKLRSFFDAVRCREFNSVLALFEPEARKRLERYANMGYTFACESHHLGGSEKDEDAVERLRGSYLCMALILDCFQRPHASDLWSSDPNRAFVMEQMHRLCARHLWYYIQDLIERRKGKPVLQLSEASVNKLRGIWAKNIGEPALRQSSALPRTMDRLCVHYFTVAGCSMADKCDRIHALSYSDLLLLAPSHVHAALPAHVKPSESKDPNVALRLMTQINDSLVADKLNRMSLQNGGNNRRRSRSRGRPGTPRTGPEPHRYAAGTHPRSQPQQSPPLRYDFSQAAERKVAAINAQPNHVINAQSNQPRVAPPSFTVRLNQMPGLVGPPQHANHTQPANYTQPPNSTQPPARTVVAPQTPTRPISLLVSTVVSPSVGLCVQPGIDPFQNRSGTTEPHRYPAGRPGGGAPIPVFSHVTTTVPLPAAVNSTPSRSGRHRSRSRSRSRRRHRRIPKKPGTVSTNNPQKP